MSNILKDILNDIDYLSYGDLPIRINKISNNSRTVIPGDLFFAIRGIQADGHSFIPMAVENRAAAIVVEKYQKNISTPQIVVQDSRAALSKAAANYYDNPSQKLKVIGITGTNGKTTTVYLLNAILKTARISRGSIGTLGYSIQDNFYPLNLTTPDSLQLQEILARMVENNISVVPMEVSAHALSLHRVDDIQFLGGIFTNISQDHLDFYETMENYVKAKIELFRKIGKSGFRLSNIDDDYSRLFNSTGDAELFTYSIQSESESDYRWSKDVRYSHGISGTILSKEVDIPITSTLSGKYNLSNILAAVSAAIQLGLSPSDISTAIRKISYIPGRLQELRKNGFPRVFVDYAHTPDAIINVLTALKDIVPSNGKLVTVFGCGGNRDKTKRPKMAEAASSLSDFVIVTTDNPRFEEPEAIIKDAIEGFSSESNYKKITDRKEAIEFAVKNSSGNDIIAILGKGHENYQEIKGVRHPFSDVSIIKELFGR
ncbi:MAG: UDP-N-acetylmuramoyl-L-alanyl-D-glutamate--2,6-diaminopimelate ligase [Candidatus Marinimicrobia bacterium]|nr:UDP-N-acetylmuramoyl-L-alanyl-D-glutamate--2,6-diaminopimelate ligase [Candidatus Neomarinimicrobiota bacterium]